MVRCSTLVLGVCLAGCATSTLTGDALGAEQAATPFTFDQYEIVTGAAERQTVLTGFLLGGAIAELVVVHIDEYGERRLRIYAFGAGVWTPSLDTTLGPDVAFIDVVNIGGHDRLITYQPGHLNWFDPESETEHGLVEVTSSFTPPRIDEIPHVDVTRDVNGDDRDDLVVPDVDGFWVFVQMERGVFADPLKIGSAADLSGIHGADGYRYAPWSQSRVHEVDYDRDGRDDLVFWNENHFVVHRQDERGLFASVAETFMTEVPFDSDQIFSLTAGDMTGRVLHSLTDLNSDGVSDLVVVSLDGRSISSKHSTYEVHLGAPTPNGGIVFAQGVDIMFRSDDRIQLAMDRHDFDGDGQVDLMFTTIEVEYLTSSLWKRWKGFWGDDIWLNLEFYRMDEGRYPDTADTTRRIQLDGTPSSSEPGWVPLDVVLRGATHQSRRTQAVWPRAFNRTLLIGDVTGDGRSDLVLERTFRELRVLVGVPGPDLFALRPQAVAVAVPNDEEYTWLVDLNKDGRQDILMHHPFTSRDRGGAPTRPPGTDPHRVTILIAR